MAMAAPPKSALSTTSSTIRTVLLLLLCRCAPCVPACCITHSIMSNHIPITASATGPCDSSSWLDMLSILHGTL
jgi:hypothetical protein